MDTLTVLAPINDGIGTFEASFCAGLPSTFDLGGFGYQQASGAPVALSRSEAVVPLDGYRVTGFECPITRNDRNALRVELGQLGGLGTSRFEFHIENAVMAKAPLAAIDLQQVLGRLSPNSIIGPPALPTTASIADSPARATTESATTASTVRPVTAAPSQRARRNSATCRSR